MNPAKFRYTFPIAKAEQRADGMYIVGEASGPEVDATMERMSPVAIERFAAQIEAMAASGNPLTYRDAHAYDGVWRDLGVITRAWIDERFHLGIEVKLDEDSPAATYLFRQLQKGKQFGMSVAGQVLDFVDEFAAEVGGYVRTYKDVMLTEISNTTRPAWTPSLGTVLSKAIDEAQAESIAKRGENDSMSDGLQTGEQTAAPADETEKADDVQPEGDADVEKTEESEGEADTAKSEDVTDNAEVADEATEKSASDEPADEAAPADVTEKATDGEADIEKAGRSISAANGKRLMALYAEMTSTLRDLGLIAEEDAPAKSDSQDSETDLVKALTVEKTALEARIEELQKSIVEKTARIEELENTPAVPAPPIVERSIEDVMETVKAMSPSERLRLGLSARHSG